MISELLEEWFGAHRGLLIHTQDLAESAHWVLACGNLSHNGNSWLDGFPAFLETTDSGQLLLHHKQDAAGTWPRHPWQPIAYAALAGVDPDETISNTSVTLRNLAIASTELGEVAPEDFGHLTIAASLLGLGKDFEISIAGRAYAVEALARACDKALDSGLSFCWGFHLAEAVLLAAFLLPLPQLRFRMERIAFARLSAARDLLVSRRSVCSPRPLRDDSVFAAGTLGESRLQFLSLAAHMIELSGLCLQFDVRKRSEIRKLVFNTLALLDELVRGWPIRFLRPRQWLIGPFAHLRRGLALTQASSDSGSPFPKGAVGPPHCGIGLRQETEASALSTQESCYVRLPGVNIGEPKIASITTIVEQLDNSNSWLIRREPRFISFRRAHWPVYVHYEIETDPQSTFVELHLEYEMDGSFTRAFQTLCQRLASELQGYVWDGYWAGCLGRLRFSTTPDQDGRFPTEAIRNFCSATLDSIESIVRSSKPSHTDGRLD